MLTSTHFIYLAIAFVLSFIAGIIFRVIYYSNTSQKNYTRIKSVFLLTIIFPIIAYKELTTNKDFFINEIEANDDLTDKQKKKAFKKLGSKNRVLLAVIINSIIRFKPILDMHIKFLNYYRNKNGKELELSIKVRFELKNWIMVTNFTKKTYLDYSLNTDCKNR